LENYFNYFTEIEEHFQRARGTPSRLSTLDWALIETWKEASIPLAAVLGGIDRTFQKFAKRPRRFQKINSLAYCSQEVLRVAEQMRTEAVEGGVAKADRLPAEAAFHPKTVLDFLRRNVRAIQLAAQAEGSAALAEDFADCGRALAEMAAHYEACPTDDLEQLERQLTAAEDKALAGMTRASSVELLASLRNEVDRELAAARQKMTQPQIETLERQFLKKRLFEHYHIPRLSLFYL
jgi:hypothetical protein